MRKNAGADIFETRELEDGVFLHTRKTRKFKTNLVKVFLGTDLSPNAARLAIIPKILARGSARYPTMRALSHRLDEMYGATTGVDSIKIGEWHVLQARTEVVANQYQLFEGNLLEEALAFIGGALLEPLVKKGGFDAVYTAEEKNALANQIESLVNDKSSYAVEMMFRRMCEHEPYGIYELGEKKNVARLTPTGLYRHYRKVLSTSPVSIYVSGNVDPGETRELVEKHLRFPRRKPLSKLTPPLIKKAGGVKRCSEKMNLGQGHLVMGFRTSAPFSSKKYVPAAIANGVFGGFPHSKLFSTVREKMGLAYSIYSSIMRTKGIVYVYAGMNGENFESAEKVVLDQLDRIKRGEISSDELGSTKKAMLKGLRAIGDSPAREIDSDFLYRLAGKKGSVDGMIKTVDSVTKKDVARAAEGFELDTVYTLGGGGEA